jgi:hypothetical protein
LLEAEGPLSSPFTLYDVADRLRERGWLVPAYSMPPNREDLVIQRILIRHGFTREMGEELLREMIFHFNCEERVVGENEQRATIGAAKDDVDRTLGHVDLADQFPRRVVDEDLPVGNIHIPLASTATLSPPRSAKGWRSVSVPSAATRAL